MAVWKNMPKTLPGSVGTAHQTCRRPGRAQMDVTGCDGRGRAVTEHRGMDGLRPRPAFCEGGPPRGTALFVWYQVSVKTAVVRSAGRGWGTGR